MTLHDGRVLMVGSGHSIGYAARIWDPDTGLWEPTASPTSGWSSHRPDAVLLNDGRVLLLLETLLETNPSVLQLEVFDPTQESFRSLDHVMPYGTMPVVMGDGRVLLATSPLGGMALDPDSEDFTLVGTGVDMDSDANVAGGARAAVSLTDGRVLLLSYDQASVFDPDTDRFTLLDPVFLPERGAATALLRDGRVLLTGGESRSYASEGSVDAQVFDPTTDRFTAIAPMMEPRSHHSAISLPDGRVVIVGGAEGRVEVFDPETGLFEQAPELSRPRENPSVTMLHDGRLLVVGSVSGARTPMGLNIDWTTLRTAEIYHPDLRSGEPSDTALSGFSLSLVPDVELGEIGERPSSSLSLSLVIPPGGLEGANYAEAVWEIDSSVFSGPGGVVWVGPDGLKWGLSGGHAERRLPEDCEQGCEIQEIMFDSKRVRTWTGLYLHIQYEGEIPEEASRITLTVVEDNTAQEP